MPWSAVISSCARHLRAMMRGEELDSESGLSHRGHVLCNLVMLLSYLTVYKEGDDRPPKFEEVVVGAGAAAETFAVNLSALQTGKTEASKKNQKEFESVGYVFSNTEGRV